MCGARAWTDQANSAVVPTIVCAAALLTEHHASQTLSLQCQSTQGILSNTVLLHTCIHPGVFLVTSPMIQTSVQEGQRRAMRQSI